MVAAVTQAPAVAPAPEVPAAPAPAAAEVAGTPLKAPMPGMIVKYQKSVGDAAVEGETVVVLEAMKMENALPAPVGGTIKAVNFASGDSVVADEAYVRESIVNPATKVVAGYQPVISDSRASAMLTIRSGAT